MMGAVEVQSCRGLAAGGFTHRHLWFYCKGRRVYYSKLHKSMIVILRSICGCDPNCYYDRCPYQ